MKRTWLAAALLIALWTALPGGVSAGGNPQNKIAVHVMPHGTACATLPSFSACSDIHTTYAGSGDIDVVPVFFDLVAYTVVEFGLTWPAEWGSIDYVRCTGDLVVGSIVHPGDGMATAWTGCQTAWSVAHGYGWLAATGAGAVMVVRDPPTGDYGVVDCAPEQEGAYDYPAAVFDAGVGGISGGDPCNQVFLQLTLSKTDGLAGSCIAHGDTLTYTITYGNTRNTLDVHGVVLVDSLPYQTSFVSASGGGTYDSGSRIVTWQIGTLGGGVQGTQSVRLMAGAPQGSSISNVCSIVSDETPATAATRTTMVCYAQTRPLSIAKTAVLSGGCVSRGANLTYSITYSNPNAYEVRGVTLTDDLPSQTEFVSASAGGSYDAGARRVTWALGGLPAKAGGSQEVTIIVNAVEGATFTNSCAITSDETGPSQASRTILVCGYGSGRNGQHKIVVHVKSHPTSCTKNYPTFTNCNQIQTTYPGVGDLDALPVFYDLTEYTVTEFGLRWPSAWGSCSFVRCKGDLAIGGISNPGDGIAIAWTACQHTWAIVPGFAWLSAMGGGGISVCADPATGDVGVVDCQPEPGPYYDHPSALLRAGVGGVVGDNPCAGPARIEGTSWGAIKAMFK